MISSKLVKAIRDYRFLIDRGYNYKSALRLVENTYLLSRLERDILFRGVHTKVHDEKTHEALKRGELLLTKSNTIVIVDLVNVVTTISEILSNSVISIGSDSILRDHAKILGRSKKSIDEVKKACNLISQAFSRKEVLLVVEKNYPLSIVKTKECIDVIRKNSDAVSVDYLVTESVDSFIINYSFNHNALVSTSDSLIITKVYAVIDLPFLVARDYLYNNSLTIDIEDIIYGLEY